MTNRAKHTPGAETLTFEAHIFVQVSVGDVREVLTDQETDYPDLSGLSDQQIDDVLYHCWRKGYVFWNIDGELDLWELERLSRDLFNIPKTEDK